MKNFKLKQKTADLLKAGSRKLRTKIHQLEVHHPRVRKVSQGVRRVHQKVQHFKNRIHKGLVFCRTKISQAKEKFQKFERDLNTMIDKELGPDYGSKIIYEKDPDEVEWTEADEKAWKQIKKDSGIEDD